MTTQILHPHPATPDGSVHSLTVEVETDPKNGLTLRYLLTGDLTKIAIPPAEPSGPCDGLWRHTCFEVFAATDMPHYREFNFSPSGQWAAYAFAGYRQRIAWTIGRPPLIRVARSPDRLLLTARLAADDLPPGRLQLGLTAVIEAIDGTLSYWALLHPREQPDFHDRAGFVHSLQNE